MELLPEIINIILDLVNEPWLSMCLSTTFRYRYRPLFIDHIVNDAVYESLILVWRVSCLMNGGETVRFTNCTIMTHRDGVLITNMYCHPDYIMNSFTDIALESKITVGSLHVLLDSLMTRPRPLSTDILIPRRWPSSSKCPTLLANSVIEKNIELESECMRHIIAHPEVFIREFCLDAVIKVTNSTDDPGVITTDGLRTLQEVVYTGIIRMDTFLSSICNDYKVLYYLYTDAHSTLREISGLVRRSIRQHESIPLSNRLKRFAYALTGIEV